MSCLDFQVNLCLSSAGIRQGSDRRIHGAGAKNRKERRSASIANEDEMEEGTEKRVGCIIILNDRQETGGGGDGQEKRGNKTSRE